MSLLGVHLQTGSLSLSISLLSISPSHIHTITSTLHIHESVISFRISLERERKSIIKLWMWKKVNCLYKTICKKLQTNWGNKSKETGPPTLLAGFHDNSIDIIQDSEVVLELPPHPNGRCHDGLISNHLINVLHRPRHNVDKAADGRYESLHGNTYQSETK